MYADFEFGSINAIINGTLFLIMSVYIKVRVRVRVRVSSVVGISVLTSFDPLVRFN